MTAAVLTALGALGCTLLFMTAAVGAAAWALLKLVPAFQQLRKLNGAIVERRKQAEKWAEEQGFQVVDQTLAGVHRGVAFETCYLVVGHRRVRKEWVTDRQHLLFSKLPAPMRIQGTQKNWPTSKPHDSFHAGFQASDEETARRLTATARSVAAATPLLFMPRHESQALVRYSPQDGPEDTARRLEGLVEFVQSYASHDDSIEALASHVADDPDPPFVADRLRNLPAEHGERFAALLAHREEPEIRVWVSLFQGDEEGVRTAGASGDTRILGHAQSALMRLGVEGLSEAKLTALAHNEPARNELAKSLEEELSTPEEANRLAGWAMKLTEGRNLMVESLAKACGRLPFPTVQPAVIQLLELDHTPSERLLIKWLRLHGTAHAVPALQAVVDRTFALETVDAQAKTAIRAIQSRVTVGAGSLAISEVEGGALSEVHEERGALSEAQRKAQTRQAEP